VTGRRWELYQAFVGSLERMEAPLTRDWLLEHDVSADEVHVLVDDVLARLKFPEEWLAAFRVGVE
jgi:hypothetical protein